MKTGNSLPILSILIPAYNEKRSIQKVIRDHLGCVNEIKSLVGGWEIVCLDDASTDETPEMLKQLTAEIKELRIITHAKNQGIHQSFQDLVKEAKGDVFYQTAADDQWPAENLIKMFKKMRDENLDYVIGVRDNRKDVYSSWRQILSWGFNLLPELFFGVKTLDANSVKLGRRAVFQIPLQSKSFFGEIERLIKAKQMGFKIGYQSIQFLPRGTGKASGAKWSNIRGTLRDFLIFWVQNLFKK